MCSQKSKGKQESKRPCEAEHASDTEDDDQKKDKVDDSDPPKIDSDFSNASLFVQYPGSGVSVHLPLGHDLKGIEYILVLLPKCGPVWWLDGEFLGGILLCA